MYPVIVYGIIGAGRCFTGSNPAYTASELQNHFKIARVSSIVTQASLLPQVLEAAKGCNIPPALVFVVADYIKQALPQDVSRFSDIMDEVEEDWKSLNEQEAKRTAVGLFTSSGTGGLPKVRFIQLGLDQPAF